MKNLLGLTVIFFCACTSYSSNNGDGGDGRDDAQTYDAGDPAGDEGGGDLGGDKSGGDPGNPVACSCKDSRDRVEGEGFCVRKNYTCNALNLCDDGYECHGSTCLCMDLDVCGLDCSSGCLCPNPRVCDERTGICRMPLACLEDEMCPDGQVCREGDHLEWPLMYYICVPPSGGGVGQQCDHSWNCLSGICHTNVCLQACESNADCPNGQYCTEANHGKLGCVLQTNCDPDCVEPDEFCDFMVCRDDNCRTHADCPGDCTLQIDRPVIGRCTERALCEDHEFVIDMGMGVYCLIYQACWTDGDCEAPYSCLSGEELMVPSDGAAFCGRMVRSEFCPGECQQGTVCDVRTGTCIQPEYCLEDEMCPQGEVCVDGMPMIDGYMCVSPSGGDLAEPCREPSDCKSGICETNICLQACRTNSDCPGAQLCSEVNHGKLGCVLLTECPPTCYGADEFCAGHACQTVNCRTSADCANDCAIDVNRPIIGECVQSTTCSDTEFFARPAAFCLIHQTCQTDADCESPYRCISTDELLMIGGGGGFCGRST